jgi:hypothetical protein
MKKYLEWIWEKEIDKQFLFSIINLIYFLKK